MLPTLPEHILHLEYDASPEEMEAAKKLVLRTNLGGLRSRLSLGYAIGLVLICGLVFLRMEGNWRHRLAWAGGGAVFYVAFMRLTRGAFEESGGRQGSADIGPAGIWFRGKSGSSLLAWAGVSHFMETPELFLLVRRKQGAFHVVPKRAFGSETEVSWFRAALEAAAAGRPIPEAPPRVRLPDPPALPADAVRIETRYGLGDAIAFRWASWRLRAFVLLILGAVGSGIGFVMVQDWRSGTVRDMKTPLTGTLIILPLMAFAAIFFVLFAWLSAGEMRQRFAMTLSSTGIALESLAGRDELPWEHFTHFKEISSHVFIWRSGSQSWTIIPKRTLTDAQVRWLREALAGKLKRSTWFWR